MHFNCDNNIITQGNEYRTIALPHRRCCHLHQVRRTRRWVNVHTHTHTHIIQSQHTHMCRTKPPAGCDRASNRGGSFLKKFPKNQGARYTTQTPHALSSCYKSLCLPEGNKNKQRQTNMSWTHPFTPDAINQYAGRGAGVYEVGTVRGGVFHPWYTGMSQSNMHTRLSAHIHGRGNSGLGDYVSSGSNNHLYFRTRYSSDPPRTEANLIRDQDMVCSGLNEVGGWGY